MVMLLGDAQANELCDHTTLPEYELSAPCSKLLQLIKDCPPSPIALRKLIRQDILGDDVFDFVIHSDLNFVEAIVAHL